MSMLTLQASDPLPGLRVRTNDDWARVQQAMQRGQILTPVLPLGDDAAYIWIPKNGCTTLKRAWFQLQRGSIQELTGVMDVHGVVHAHTHWLRPEELAAVARHRRLMAIWRDPIDRFVSACRSHLVELTTERLRARFQATARGDQSVFNDLLRWHHDRFTAHRVRSFSSDAAPAAVMNQVALQLPAWSQCHIDWSHHSLPQVSFLGGDPSLYHTILGMESIESVIHHWSSVSGLELDASPQHVSATLAAEDPWRRVHREQLSVEALQALETFYAADRAFLALAQHKLGSWSFGSDQDR